MYPAGQLIRRKFAAVEAHRFDRTPEGQESLKVIVKGFRTPARHRREGGARRRRPKTLEGGNSGEVSDGGGVDVLGFGARA